MGILSSKEARMQKLAKYISNSLFIIAALFFLVGLFKEYPISWQYIWLFLAPSIIIQESIHMPEKGRKRIYSFIYISFAFLMFGVAVMELINR
jgi:hypothetical protein